MERLMMAPTVHQIRTTQAKSRLELIAIYNISEKSGADTASIHTV